MAQTLAEILSSGQLEVNEKGFTRTMSVPPKLRVGIHDVGGQDLLEWFKDELNTDEQIGLLQKGLAQVVIDLRARARGNDKESLADDQAQRRIDAYRLKPMPLPSQKKKAKSLEDYIAEFKAEGLTETEIMAKVSAIIAETK